MTVKAPAIWRRADVLRHLTNQLAKRRLAEQEIGRLLVLPAKNGGTLQREGSRGIKGSLPDLPQCSRSWPPPVGFLDPTRPGGTLASRLGGNSPLRRLTASGPARSLLYIFELHNLVLLNNLLYLKFPKQSFCWL